jgi:exopolyphosphatase/guanosine-5'-triphosphate,3'-diphosphate pyrophosphatase
MKNAVIDIGTNTILLLIAEYSPNYGLINTITDIQQIPRLGKSVDKNKNILPESFTKAVNILNDYKNLCINHNVNKITSVATSFIRDANNKSEFIDEIKNKTGIEIEILSGEEEAKWTFIGGVYDKIYNSDFIVTLDIGGGSTEITKNIKPVKSISNLFNIELNSISLNIGSVRIHEKFISSHPPKYDEIIKAEAYINENLKSINFDFENCELIGLAGTITTIGAFKLKLPKFIPDKVDNLILDYTDVENILTLIACLKTEELLAAGNYMEGRADIIFSGILILKCFMQKLEFKKISISTKGLRYGILMRELHRNKLI